MRDHRRQPAETATSAQPGPIFFASETVGRRRLILAGMAGNVMEWYDFIVTSLLAWSHDALAPAYYLMAAAVVSLGALLRWRDTTQAPLP